MSDKIVNPDAIWIPSSVIEMGPLPDSTLASGSMVYVPAAKDEMAPSPDQCVLSVLGRYLELKPVKNGWLLEFGGDTWVLTSERQFLDILKESFGLDLGGGAAVGTPPAGSNGHAAPPAPSVELNTRLKRGETKKADVRKDTKQRNGTEAGSFLHPVCQHTSTNAAGACTACHTIYCSECFSCKCGSHV